MSFLRFSGFLWLSFCLLLAGCGEALVMPPRFTPPNTPGGRLCISECGQSRQYCRQSCDLDQRACMQVMQTQAIKDYNAYVQEQYKEHQPVELRPRDFERPRQCATAACYKNCDQDHQSCYENCGGTVTINSSCQFMCF